MCEQFDYRSSELPEDVLKRLQEFLQNVLVNSNEDPIEIKVRLKRSEIEKLLDGFKAEGF